MGAGTPVHDAPDSLVKNLSQQKARIQWSEGQGVRGNTLALDLSDWSRIGSEVTWLLDNPEKKRTRTPDCQRHVARLPRAKNKESRVGAEGIRENGRAWGQEKCDTWGRKPAVAPLRIPGGRPFGAPREGTKWKF